MEAKLMLFASVALVLFEAVLSQNVKLYDGAKPSNDVLSRIDEIRKSLNCKAHVLQTNVTRTSTDLNIIVNLRGLPSHTKNSFIFDELYINIQNGATSNSAQTSNNQELWVKERQNNTLLARVPLNTGIAGYKAVKLRRVFASWRANNKNTGFLKLNVPTIQLASSLEKSKSYVVLYAYSLATGVPSFVKCESYDVMIRPQSPNREFKTKICSHPNDVTFPFNASKIFDVGAALQKSLKDNPVESNAAVLRNPKCCYAMKAVSRKFVGVFPKENGALTFGTVELQNVQVTKCGCGV